MGIIGKAPAAKDEAPAVTFEEGVNPTPGTEQHLAETAADGGLTQVTEATDALAVLAAGAAAPLADQAAAGGVALTGKTVDGGGSSQAVVLVNRYAFIAKLDGEKYHLVAERGDVVTVTPAELERGEGLGALTKG